MKIDKNILFAAVAAFALAWFMFHSDGGIPNPFTPQRPKRPVLAFIMKAAKTFLWVAAFAEPKPTDLSAHSHTYIVKAGVGPDGHELLDHAEAF